MCVETATIYYTLVFVFYYFCLRTSEYIVVACTSQPVYQLLASRMARQLVSSISAAFRWCTSRQPDREASCGGRPPVSSGSSYQRFCVRPRPFVRGGGRACACMVYS